jgi:RNase P/RNase MRP subunit POP5
MAIKNDIDELLWYAVISANESEGEEWADELLGACRRVYESNIRQEATAKVDKWLKESEKKLAKEGKVIANRAHFRKEQVAVVLCSYKSFDEWRKGF